MTSLLGGTRSPMDGPITNAEVFSLLFPAKRAVVEVPSEEMNALGDEASDAILILGTKLLGRRCPPVMLSADQRQAEATILRLGGRLEPSAEPNPLDPAQDDPTWHIRKFERELELNARLDRLQRSEARRRRAILKRERELAKEVEEALAAQGIDASILEGHEVGHSASLLKPIRLASSARRSTTCSLRRLALAIELVRGDRLRDSLRLKLRRLIALIARRSDVDRPALALASVPAAPVQAAGGKTGRYAQRD